MSQWRLVGKVLNVKEISQRILGIINLKKEVILGPQISAKKGQSLLILLENNFQFGGYNEHSFFYKIDLFKKWRGVPSPLARILH